MKPFATLSLIALALLSAAATRCSAAPDRQILICTSQSAPAEVTKAADLLADSATTAPALKALLDAHEASALLRMTSEKVLADGRANAYNHLVIVGLKDSDPLLAKVWDHYAAVDESTKTLTSLGWGKMKGDIGLVAGDWNPFLHSHNISAAPFEAEEFKISGTSAAGVVAAVAAFRQGLDNGLVPAGPISRPETTILDLDPNAASPPVILPATVPATGAFELAAGVTALVNAGWTSPGASEYRAYFDVGGHEPLHVWRVKYLQPGVLSGPWSPLAWVDGYHPMAYGNAVTIAQFASADDATQVAASIGHAPGWRDSALAGVAAAWVTDQPTDEILAKSYGKVFVFARGLYVFFSSLPKDATTEIIAAR